MLVNYSLDKCRKGNNGMELKTQILCIISSVACPSSHADSSFRVFCYSQNLV